MRHALPALLLLCLGCAAHLEERSLMGTPVIAFDVDQGLDDNTQSGSGPATAVSGTKARTRAAGSVRVGFFEASAVDLSLVNTDGTHAPRIVTGAGRQWTKTNGTKKTSRQSVTGNMTNGSAILSAMGSTGGMSPDDPIRVIGAGGGSSDLYSEILTVDSGTQVTLKDSSGHSVTGAAVLAPEFLTLAHSFTLTSDTAWAVGGLRSTLNGSSQLFSDWAGGWIVELRVAGGVHQTVTSSITLTTGGDTAGKVKIRTLDSTQVIATGATVPFKVRTTGVIFEGIPFGTAASGVELDSTAAGDFLMDGCSQLVLASNLCRVTSAASPIERIHFRNCQPGQGNIRIQGKVRGLLLENIYLQDGVLEISAPCFGAVRYVLAYGITGGNYAILATGWGAAGGLMIEHFSGLGAYGKGIGLDLDSAKGIVVRNSVFTGFSGTALECAAGTDAVASQIDFNCFFGNNLDRANVSAGAHDIAADPRVRNAAGGDFRTGLALDGKGFPVSLPGGLTSTYLDLGYVQRRRPLGGSILLSIYQAQDLGSEVQVAFDIQAGNADGSRSARSVDKAFIPVAGELDLGAVDEAVVSALRDGQAIPAIQGQEVLA